MTMDHNYNHNSVILITSPYFHCHYHQILIVLAVDHPPTSMTPRLGVMALLAINPSSHIVSMVFSLYSWKAPDLMTWDLLIRCHSLPVYIMLFDMNSIWQMEHDGKKHLKHPWWIPYDVQVFDSLIIPSFCSILSFNRPSWYLYCQYCWCFLPIGNKPSENWLQRNPHRDKDICLYCVYAVWIHGMVSCYANSWICWQKLMINHQEIISMNCDQATPPNIAKHHEAVS